MLRVEIERAASDANEAPQQQPRANQQHEGEGDLRRDERTAQAMPTGLRPRAPDRFLERTGEIHLERGERRRQTEQQPGKNREPSRDQQHRHGQADLADSQPSGRRDHRDQAAKPPPRDEHAEGAADARQQHAFGKKLADDAAAAGAERQPDGDLGASHRTAREQETGDVGARDQQRQQHRRSEGEQPLPRPSEQGLVQRHDARAPSRAFGELRGELRADGRQVGLGLLNCHAVFQTGCHHEEAGRALKLRLVERQRRPIIHVVVGIPECRRHHADDRRRHAVQPDVRVDDVRILGEASLPERMADDHHRRRPADLRFGVGEHPAEERAGCRASETPMG